MRCDILKIHELATEFLKDKPKVVSYLSKDRRVSCHLKFHFSYVVDTPDLSELVN